MIENKKVNNMTLQTQNVVVLNRDGGRSKLSCHDCTKASVCPAFSAGSMLRPGDSGAPIHRNVRPGQTIYNAGDEFRGFYMVKSGFFKSSFIDSDGVLQVTDFFFPGEMFGFDGIDGGQHNAIVEALDIGSVCKIPLALTGGRVGSLWNIDTLVILLQTASESISRDREMMYALGKLSARRRFATFILDISRRMARSGFGSDAFKLCMSRNDIANNLCLAVETVSRLFTQFQNQGLIDVVRRDMRIIDRERLKMVAEREFDSEHLVCLGRKVNASGSYQRGVY